MQLLRFTPTALDDSDEPTCLDMMQELKRLELKKNSPISLIDNHAFSPQRLCKENKAMNLHIHRDAGDRIQWRFEGRGPIKPKRERDILQLARTT